MIQKILIMVYLCVSVVQAETFRTVEKAATKQMAIEKAYWVIFESALDKVVGMSSYTGNIKKSFKSDMEKDYDKFYNEHFRNQIEKCNDLKGDGFECLVISNININKLKAIVSLKANSTTTMGRNSIKDLKIVLIDNINTDISNDFTPYMQSSINDAGHSFELSKKGTQVGLRGNNCKELKSQRIAFIKKGTSYTSAVKAIDKKLKECIENQDIQYVFELDKLIFTKGQVDSYNDITGTLSYRIIIINTQTGKQNSAVKPQIVNATASDINSLKFKLYEIASKKASREITDNILRILNSKQKDKKLKPIKKFDYFYTVIVQGATLDSQDRGKLKLVRDGIKKFNVKPIRNSKESKDYEQVYNFGTNNEIDIEDFMYELYDIADSVGLPIKVYDNGDKVISLQFQ